MLISDKNIMGLITKQSRAYRLNINMISAMSLSYVCTNMLAALPYTSNSPSSKR